jgi:cytochrome c
MSTSARPTALLFWTACLLLAGCRGGEAFPTYSALPNGDPHLGKEVIRAYGCGACHVIPGIREARGLVGPPLYFFGQRTMIAGELPNTPDNLVRWVRNPRAIEPGTAMPDLGLSEDQAENVAAYLYTIH